MLLSSITAFAQPVKFGITNVTPQRILEFPAQLTSTAKWEASRAGFPSAVFAKGALAVPDGFTPAKSWPILLVSASSGDSPVRALPQYTNAALRAGWVVLGAEGPKVKMQQDTHTWNQAMLASVLSHLHKCWPLSRQWPVVCAGFSGGAKRSGIVAAALMKQNYHVAGIFMAGCNEDHATAGLRLYQPGERFKAVPIFLSNGTRDPIAGPEQQADVKQSLQREGFKNVRTETFDGSHRLNSDQLKLALTWFRSQSSPDR